MVFYQRELSAVCNNLKFPYKYYIIYLKVEEEGRKS